MTGTRERLLDAATRVFAEQGVAGASLLAMAQQAGQRNRGAVHYHFGSREKALVAVLEQYAGFLAARERELLDLALAHPEDQLAPVVEAIVRPAVELAETGWRGRCYLLIVAELAEVDPDTLDPEIAEALQRTGGHEVYALLAQRLPPLPAAIVVERLSLVTTFILRSVADRARAGERDHSRPQLGTEDFVANLIAMVAAMAAASRG